MTEPRIYAALAAVMADCSHVAKRDRNEHQRYIFRGVDAVVNAVGPILRKHAVVVVPDVESATYDTVETSTGKPATACRLLVRYTFYADDGSSISTRVAAEAWDSGDKAAPKGMSVAFRTALLQALALPTDEPDPDTHTYEQVPPGGRVPAPATRRMGRESAPKAAEPNPMTADQRSRMFALFNERGIADRDQQLAGISAVLGRPVTTRKDLDHDDAAAVIRSLLASKPTGGTP